MASAPEEGIRLLEAYSVARLTGALPWECGIMGIGRRKFYCAASRLALVELLLQCQLPFAQMRLFREGVDAVLRGLEALIRAFAG